MDNSWWGPIGEPAPVSKAQYCWREGCSCGLPKGLGMAPPKRLQLPAPRTYIDRDGKWVPYENVMRPKDAFRFERVILDIQRPRSCGVHWSHFVNGKLKYAQPHPAVAIWNGRWYLCEDALNNWLDNADDDPSLEPDRLVFL